MKRVTINFTDGDCVVFDCLDMVLNNGFLTIFLPEDEEGTKTVQAYNAALVADFEFNQFDEGEDEE